jgi:uncharacterized protein with HEPN domain
VAFRDDQIHLRDILEGIDPIESFVTGTDLDAYRKDVKTKSAVERQLQIVWNTVKDELPPMREAIKKALAQNAGNDSTRTDPTLE